MNGPDWERVNRLFDGALERPPEERAAFLASACGDDAELRDRVERLLAAHDRARDFIETPAVLASPTDPEPPAAEGTIVGPWRILREIGHGGMGTVYLAERADRQFEQRIALKRIRAGMDTESVLRRFRTERQILAQLDHPNIGRLLDGGSTGDGRPYFAMEFIEGDPIDRWCDAHRAPIARRIELFRQVCAAVAYAHQHLVVHRDIKPSNVLVDAGGRARLLDFGIARLLQDEDEEGRTATGLLVMTPEFASPEQILGARATTLSDVYSLGVVLYALLCGRPPRRFTTRSLAEIAREIERSDPLRPSLALQAPDPAGGAGAAAAAVAAERSTTVERLRRRLSGDLDLIVLKALHRDPRRRYATAEQLSEDLRRHLAGLPVIARRDTIGYRARKFARRNRMGVIAAAVVMVSLVGGVAATSWQARRAREAQARAERRFAELRHLAHSVMFDYHDAIKDLPGATPIRERMVKDGLAYLDGLARDAGSDLSLQRDLAAGYDRLAQVQGGTLFANLGNTTGALESFAKAQKIYDALWKADSLSEETRRGTASHLVQQAKLLWETGALSTALENTGRSIPILESLVQAHPDDAELRHTLLAGLDTDMMIRIDRGDSKGAADRGHRQVEIVEAQLRATPRDPALRRAMSVAQDHLGSALLGSGEYEAALEANRRAIDLREGLSKEFPLNADYRRALSVGYYNEGEILVKLGRNREALADYRREVEISTSLSRVDPRNEQYRGDRAYGEIRVGDMLAQLGDARGAVAAYRASFALREQDVRADPANHWKRASLIEAHAKLARVLARLGDARFDEHVRGALALMDRTKLEPGDMQLRSFFATTLADLGEALATVASGPAPAAVRHTRWRRALELYERSADTWSDLTKRGILAASDADQPRAVALQIERCEKALRGRF